MNPLVVRKGRLFCLVEEEFPEVARNSGIMTALYAAIHFEFAGASKNLKYKRLTNQQKMGKLNEFARDWLEQRGYK